MTAAAPPPAATAPAARPDPTPASRVVDAGLVVMFLFAPVSISGTQAGLGIALAGLAWESARTRRFPRTPFDEPILVFLAVTLLSALLSGAPGPSLRRFAGGWGTLALYATVAALAAPGRAARFLRLLAPPAVVFGAYGILQHFTGWNLFGSGGGGMHSLVIGERTVWFPRGGFSHYQTFANVYFVLFCLLLGLAAGATERRGRLLAGGGALVAAAAVVFSFTRGVWLALLAALGVFAWTFARRAALTLAAALAAALLLVLLVPSSVRTRALSMADLGSNVERLLLWETTWTMLRDRPALGVGVGNYRRAQDEYVRDEVPLTMTRTHAHNIWLQVAVERGILGLLAFTWVCAAVLREAAGAVARLRPAGGMPFALAAGCLAALAGFFLDGLVQNNFGDAQVALLFWTVAGLVLCVGGGARVAAGRAA